MCWNQTVSLNTFVFSFFVLLLIIYNNAFTKYKIQELNSIWVYLFLMSFIFMQLIEFFIWRNINNKYYNNLFSILATCLLISQPIFSVMMLSNINLRNILVIVYLLIALPYSIYKFSTKKIYTFVGKSGHLKWDFFDASFFIMLIWCSFFFFSFIYDKKWLGFLFGIFTLYFMYLTYKKDETMWSMWCWIVNSIMIYFAFYLLILLPFYEKGCIC
jgi:hypothetical protein